MHHSQDMGLSKTLVMDHSQHAGADTASADEVLLDCCQECECLAGCAAAAVQGPQNRTPPETALHTFRYYESSLSPLVLSFYRPPILR